METISRGEGRTILFVSHNMAAIERLCSRAVVLDSGKVSFDGNTREAVEQYLVKARPTEGTIIQGIKKTDPDLEIREITINDRPENQVLLSDSLTLNVTIRGNLKSAKKMALEVRMYDSHEKLLALYSPGHLYGRLHECSEGPFELNETIQFPDNMTSGDFSLDLDLTRPNIETYLQIPRGVSLSVRGITGATGLEFTYSGSGFLMLK